MREDTESQLNKVENEDEEANMLQFVYVNEVVAW